VTYLVLEIHGGVELFVMTALDYIPAWALWEADRAD
jgi:hypothetical protein